MQVDVLALVVSTSITGVVGWVVKSLLDSFKAYMADSASWRSKMDERIDAQREDMRAVKDATQTTMRTSLLHYAEKYLTRGWVTPEERASIYDMHQKYSALNANGYIDSYIERVMALPDREI